MADNSISPPFGSNQIPPPASTSTLPRRSSGQHPLSCTYCRQRKIKCDRIYPCANCQKSKLNCVFPERVKHAKKRRNDGKATTDELMRRLGKMEELIEKMKDEGDDANAGRKYEEPYASPIDTAQLSRHTSEEVRSQHSTGSHEGDLNRFVAGSFWSRLTTEVEGLRQTMDEVSDDEEASHEAAVSPASHTAHSSVLLGGSPMPSHELRMLHPSPTHMQILYEIFTKQVDPMVKVLHIPTVTPKFSKATANVQDIPSGNYVEALLFAIYYSAITAITPQQCLQHFQDDRSTLLVKYRTGVESALVNADFLNANELCIIQALIIFLAAVRSNDDSQFSWSMIGIAVRLGTALGLHRENSRPGLTPFITELRRRAWWNLIALDIRAVEERGTDPIIIPGSFNTKMPLNIHDEDISPDSLTLPAARDEFTIMTKTIGTSIIWPFAMRIGWFSPVQEGEDPSQLHSFADRENALDELVLELRNQLFRICDPSNPLAWTTSVVARLVLCRLRLVLYHPPLHDSSHPTSSHISGDTVLKVATELNEYSHLMETEAAAAPWKWFLTTYVQWHALAAALAELCVRDKGPLVERAWRIVDVVFPVVSTRIADSKHGMLWRPIKKLMNKAQAKRNESLSMSIRLLPQAQVQQPLPEFGSTFFAPPQPMDASASWTSSDETTDADIAVSDAPKGSIDWNQGPSSDAFASLNVSESLDSINWAEWDQFMQDFALEEQPGMVNPNAPLTQSNEPYTWW